LCNSHYSLIKLHLLSTRYIQVFFLTILQYKKDKTSMTNYKPISLLTVFSKVLEKAMHSRLSQHLHTNNTLVTEQYGFRKGISTCRLTDSVFKSINQRMNVGGNFCDLAKAFDCMNHEILLAKLHIHGIQEDWFRSYLSNSRQTSKANHLIQLKIFV